MKEEIVCESFVRNKDKVYRETKQRIEWENNKWKVNIDRELEEKGVVKESRETT